MRKITKNEVIYKIIYIIHIFYQKINSNTKVIFGAGATLRVNQQTLVNFNLLIQLFELQVLKLKIVY